MTTGQRGPRRPGCFFPRRQTSATRAAPRLLPPAGTVTGMWAVFNGDPAQPAVLLRFEYSAAHHTAGTPLREWVKTLPHVEVADKDSWTWRASEIGKHPDRVLADAGFHVIGPDGTDTSLAAWEHPLAIPCSEYPGMVFIQPRLAGRAAAEPFMPLSATWREGERRWLVPAADVLAATELAQILESTPGLVLADLPAADLEPDRPLTTNQELLYDHTLDGLRGVPVTDLASVNRPTAQSMQNFGIDTVFDLLHHIPLRYIDRTNPVHLAEDLVGTKIALLGVITGIIAPKSKKQPIVIHVKDPAGSYVSCKFFNASWMIHKFHSGMQVVLHGKLESFVSNGRTRYSISNPLMDEVRDDGEAILPIYGQSAKAEITTWQLHRAAQEAVRRLGEMLDPIPDDLLTRHGLMSRSAAYHRIHRPDSIDLTVAARDRLAYDELLRLQLAMRVESATETALAGTVHVPTGRLQSQMLAKLAYTLTGAQVRAVEEVDADMRSERPMNRLVQGDVGSGKTDVIIQAMLKAVESGCQASLMAPTEILAAQHFYEIVERLENIVLDDGTSVRAVMVTNKVTGAARKQALADLAADRAHIAVGTHALLADSVQFAALGLAVVDEQHRFGIDQRAALSKKGPAGHVPDMMFTTATPIPRTAVMTVFGDLDVSVLDEMPPGRTPIQTSWVHPDSAPTSSSHAQPWALIRDQVAQGRQAFVVCPMVSGDSETKAAASAEGLARELGTFALDGLTIGIAHGKQKPEDRSAVMADFAAGRLDVLVATTVIEVGVNVPNATVIVIVGADRFGIAQLHQLRGRVGRGQHPGHCVLVADAKTSDAKNRMEALVGSTDGFYLSEVDLKMRGWGTLLGSAQAGTATDLRVADLFRDEKIISWAREDALGLLAHDPHLARRPGLRDEVGRAVSPEARAWLVST
jgi:ATP-dependent DNA helicase RecG